LYDRIGVAAVDGKPTFGIGDGATGAVSDRSIGSRQGLFGGRIDDTARDYELCREL
jgi:hypothetical protein